MFADVYARPMERDGAIPFELPGWIALAPFEEYLGMRIDTASDGSAVLSMPFKGAHCQGKGLMHGGAVVALADTALAIAIKTLLPENTHFATIAMALEFHAPIRWGRVTAKAVAGDRRDRDIAGEVAVETEEGIRAATFRATFRVKRGIKECSGCCDG